MYSTKYLIKTGRTVARGIGWGRRTEEGGLRPKGFHSTHLQLHEPYASLRESTPRRFGAPTACGSGIAGA